MLKVLDTTTETEETPATPTLDDLAPSTHVTSRFHMGQAVKQMWASVVKTNPDHWGRVSQRHSEARMVQQSGVVA